MESVSKKNGKKFHGKFAGTAVRLGLADPIENTEEIIPEEVQEDNSSDSETIGQLEGAESIQDKQEEIIEEVKPETKKRSGTGKGKSKAKK